MTLSITDIKKIAKLARIKISDEEVEYYRKDLNKIFNWIEQLQEINTDGIEPMTGVEDQKLPLRADEVKDGNIREQVLSNAAVSKYGYFVVPKVIE